MSMNFVTAMMRFFGKKKDQTLREFADELKTLTTKDREEFAKLLTKELGEEVTL